MLCQNIERSFNISFAGKGLGLCFIGEENIDFLQGFDQPWRRHVHLDVLAVRADFNAKLTGAINERSPVIVEREALQKKYFWPDPLQISRRRTWVLVFTVTDKSSVISE